MIHAYAYRTPRVAASLAVEFVTEGGVLSGHTRDISEHGLRADFGEPVLPKTAGRVRFRTGRCLLELEAHVSHTEGYTAGLVFVFASEAESSFVRAILDVLQRTAEHPESAED